MFQNIPEEMRRYNQFIVWKLEDVEGAHKPTKVPYSPRTGKLASVSDASTWSTFDEAVNASFNGYNGIGFVFTRHDPFTGIDLDDPYEKHPDGSFVHADPDAIMERQKKIHATFASYSEYSPSGKGLHIITRGQVPSGRRRSSVEVYSEGRYFTMTGRTFSPVPIADRNNLLQVLWGEMAKGAEAVNYYSGDIVQQHEDEQIIHMASTAVNGQKFNDLYGGNFSFYYSSQSEADFALIDIIAHYTKHRMQIVRLFQNSALGQRAKAQRGDYLTKMVDKSFDRMLPPVDFSELINQYNEALASAHNPNAAQFAFKHDATAAPVFDAHPVTAPAGASIPQTVDSSPARPTSPKTPFGTNAEAWRKTPSGLLGAITDFIYAQAPRPVYEIALVGALGLMAGMAGRAYNVSGTGLNHYILALAGTGTGKEAIASGAEKLLNAVSRRVAHAKDVIGPAELASGQALLKHLSKRLVPCCVSITGEIGLKLKMVTAPNAIAADKALVRALLDLYNKSGAGHMVRPMVYSDSQNNTEDMHSPAYSLVGEGVPETFYEALDDTMIASGLLPRFIIIEYKGVRVPLNEQAWLVQPDDNLVSGIETLIMTAHDAMNNAHTINCIATKDAASLLSQINAYSDDMINNADNEIVKQLWNRAHIKTLKMAALLAVSDNPNTPRITFEHVEWAISLIGNDINGLTQKFKNGEVGEAHEQSEQYISVCNIVSKYLETDAFKLKGVDQTLRQNMMIAKRFIQNSIGTRKGFNKVPNRSKAIADNIRDIVTNGALRPVSPAELSKLTTFAGETYAIVDPKYFVSKEYDKG